jgi:hypothetical protein
MASGNPSCFNNFDRRNNFAASVASFLDVGIGASLCICCSMIGNVAPGLSSYCQAMIDRFPLSDAERMEAVRRLLGERQ